MNLVNRKKDDFMEADLQRLKEDILLFCKKYKIVDFSTVLQTQGRNANGTIIYEDVVLIVTK